jgi:xanthine dehydrogenase accessory factor
VSSAAVAYPQILVYVVRTEGSVPREIGAFMRVDAQTVSGTVGGGHLEFQAIVRAREWLYAPRAREHAPADMQRVDASDAERDHAASTSSGAHRWPVSWRQRCPLGPSLGQCCGGVVWLDYVWIASDADWRPWAKRLAPPRIPVAVFGGGHVGTALIRALAPLPFAVRWIDSREGFSSQPSAALVQDRLPGVVVREEIDPVEDAVSGLPEGTRVLIMSFSHAEDLQVVRACLARNRMTAKGEGVSGAENGMANAPAYSPVGLSLPFIGLIGSKTKWARFRHRLADYGFDDQALGQVTCPIGLPEIVGKEPEVIAASVVAQLLGLRGRQTPPLDAL